MVQVHAANLFNIRLAEAAVYFEPVVNVNAAWQSHHLHGVLPLVANCASYDILIERLPYSESTKISRCSLFAGA